MKKIIVWLFASLLLFVSAEAGTPQQGDRLQADYNRASRQVNISGVVSGAEAGSRAVVIVLNKDFDFDGDRLVKRVKSGGAETKETAAVEDAIRYIKEVVLSDTPEEGSFVFPTFEMPENGDVGHYAVRVSVEDKVMDTSFYFITTEQLKSALNAVNRANVDALATVLPNNANVLEVDVSVYNRLSADSKTFVNEKLVKLDIAAADTDGAAELSTKTTLLSNTLATACAFAELGDAKTAAKAKELAETHSSVYRLDLISADGIYASLNGKRQDAAWDRMAGKYFDTPVSIQNAFKQQCVLAILAEAKWGEIEQTLRAYKTLLEINITEFEVLGSSGDRDSVCKLMAGKSQATPQDMEMLVKNSVKAVLDMKKDKNEQSSSKSSDSGTKITFPTVPIVPDNNNQSNTKPIFSDLNGYAWAETSITVLYEKGIINGKEEGVFDPSGEVTRAEFVKMLVVCFVDNYAGAKADFADMNESDWFYPYVAAAAQNNLAGGYEDGSFRAESHITRQDMAVLALRFVNRYKEVELPTADKAFADGEAIELYAAEAVSKLAGAGVINGAEGGNFLPQNNVSRAEAAKIIYGVLNLK